MLSRSQYTFQRFLTQSLVLNFDNLETLHIVREMIKHLPLLPRDKLGLIIARDHENQISSTLDSAFQASSQEISIAICLQCESQSLHSKVPQSNIFQQS